MFKNRKSESQEAFSLRHIFFLAPQNTELLNTIPVYLYGGSVFALLDSSPPVLRIHGIQTLKKSKRSHKTLGIKFFHTIFA
jgi:hypothetical protein